MINGATWFPLFMVLCTLLSGCTHENKYRAELATPLNVNANTGVIILSVGAREPCPLFSSATELRLFQAEGPFYPAAAVASLEINVRYVESEFADHHGRLYVLPLRSGKYVLVPSLMTPAEYYVTPPKADFEVYANESAYLGEFYMPDCNGSGGMLFRDQETRDRAMLVAKNPDFGNVQITKRLLMFTGREPWYRNIWPF